MANLFHSVGDLFGTPIPDTVVFDELQFSYLTDVPVALPVGFGLAVLAVSGIWLFRFSHRGRRSLQCRPWWSA